MKEKLQCDNCGGILDHEGFDIFVCKYCGMKYKITGWERTEYPVIKFVENPSKYKVVGASLMVAEEAKVHLGEHYDDIVKKELVRKISDYMLDNFDEVFDYTSDYDLCQMVRVHNIKIRILKGDLK